MWHNEWPTSCTQCVLNSHWSGYSAVWLLHGWCHMKLLPLGASSVWTIQPYTSLHCHFIWSCICKMYVCLAVTCHLHFWQNDQDLLRAAAVTQGWNGYRNKNQHKIDLGKENYPIAPARTRTWDLLITSLVTLPLSHPSFPILISCFGMSVAGQWSCCPLSACCGLRKLTCWGWRSCTSRPGPSSPMVPPSMATPSRSPCAARPCIRSWTSW